MVRGFHSLKPYRRRLGTSQLALLAVMAFAATVIGGLYGPQLAGRLAGDGGATIPNPPSLSFGPYFRSCRDAQKAGVYAIRRDEPGYRPALDADGDGVACEAFVGPCDPEGAPRRTGAPFCLSQ